ncbi:MAG: hypothetical protein PHX34_02555 [Candidatus Shapirobacteria bacterium]|nr:hypothetical protein [Candidatus Shapirobacteria bacterium]
MNKLITLGIVLTSSFILSACTVSKTISPIINDQNNQNQPTIISSDSHDSCNSQPINIEGYGDPGQKLSNCFVQYPGEPSRQDKSYYIVEDICGQFTPEFISNNLGKKIIDTKEIESHPSYSCSYYWNEQRDYIMLTLNYLKSENQKTGQESLGRTVKTENSIPMNNYIAYQENGIINSIYLILGDEKFISIKTSSDSDFSANELITFAANIAQAIKNYK